MALVRCSVGSPRVDAVPVARDAGDNAPSAPDVGDSGMLTIDAGAENSDPADALIDDAVAIDGGDSDVLTIDAGAEDSGAIDGGSRICTIYTNVPGILCSLYTITMGPYGALACLNPPFNQLPYQDYAVCPSTCIPPAIWAEYATYYGDPTYCVPKCMDADAGCITSM